MQRLELIEHLKKIKLFKKVDDAFFDLFIPIISIHKYSEKDFIIHEGDTGRDMFLLLKGTVRIVKKTMSGDQYTAALLKDEYGIFFGEVGLLSEDKRTASVVAETQCELAQLTNENFDIFVKKYPVYGVQLLQELSQSICQKLQKANHDTVVLYEALIGEIGQSFL